MSAYSLRYGWNGSSSLTLSSAAISPSALAASVVVYPLPFLLAHQFSLLPLSYSFSVQSKIFQQSKKNFLHNNYAFIIFEADISIFRFKVLSY
jgi:hypothetical protein